MMRVLLLLFLSTCTGCVTYDAKGTSQRTRHNLTLIARVLEKLPEGERLNIQNSAQFLALAETRNLIADRLDFECDGWRQVFQWRVERKADDTVIRVISVGLNGIFEDGAGDDIELQF